MTFFTAYQGFVVYKKDTKSLVWQLSYELLGYKDTASTTS